MLINPYRFASAAPTLTYFSQFFWTRTGDESDKSGYSYRVIVPSSALSCSGQKVRLTLMAASGEGCVIDHVSIGEYAGSGYDVTGSLTEVTFTGSSGCTILADGVKSSDYITLAADAAKSYVVVIDVATSANDSLGTSGSHTGFDTGYKSATASWNQTTVSGFSSATAGLCIGLKEISIGADIDASTVLLLHGDGPQDGTSVQDFSSSAHTVTCSGDAKVDRSQSKFGGASLLLGGTADSFTVADSSAWNLVGDFTLEFFMRADTFNNSGFDGILSGRSTADTGWVVWLSSGNKIKFLVGSTYIFDYTHSMSTGTWYHIAMVRSGSIISLYIGGSSVATYNYGTGTISHESGQPLAIGRFHTDDVNYNYKGYLDDIRISSSARYTSDFTPTTKEFGA